MDEIIETTIEDLYNFYRLYPEYKCQIEVETRFGFYAVEECDITAYNSEIIEIFTNNNSIKCSPDHRLFVNNKWTYSKDIKKSDKILTKNGNEEVISIKKLDYRDDLYDLQVKDVNEFYANNIVSHNSAILDALSFCLFGRAYRDIKIKDLINRKNKKDTEVSCIFTVDDRDSYEVKRTLNPNTLEIIKNGTESDLLSSKKLNQEELNKILGINYNLFKQVISLAVNYNKPFLSLPIQDKRDIIEQIFNISVFGLMLKEAKKINADNIVRNDINNNSIKLLEENLKTLRRNLKEINQAIKDFEKNKTEELEDIDKRIKKYNENITDLDNNIKEINRKINEVDIDKVNKLIKENKDKLEEITKIINKEEYIINNNNNNIKNFETDIICPRCNTILSSEHKEKEINRLKIEIQKSQEKLIELQKEKTETENKLENYENVKQNYNKLIIDNKNMTEKKNLLDTELTHLKENQQKIIDRKLDMDIESIHKEFNKKIEEYKTIYKNTSALKKVIENYETVFNILSETGIKTFFFKKLIPILNTKVNEYLQMFEIPIILLFDEVMNEKITNYGNMNTDVSYYAYSEGEKKRIDMSILLSFISMTKAISNWNCNLLLIDELLDGAIDEAGLDKLVTSLKNMTYESNLCIYIISHRLQQDYNSRFNMCLHIEKENDFSRITYI